MTDLKALKERLSKPRTSITVETLDKNKGLIVQNNKSIIKAGLLALILLSKDNKSDSSYKEPVKSEKEIKITEYIKSNNISDYCYYHEKYKCIELKTAPFTLGQLKDIANILEVDDIKFEVSEDYDGCLESQISWSDENDDVRLK